METNYELKNKLRLLPLKAAFLMLVMTFVGFSVFGQGKSVRVTNNDQLIEAMQNFDVGTIELSAGYYESIDVHAASGTTVVKQKPENGNRNLQCQYFIIGSDVCFIPDNTGFAPNLAQAGFQDVFLCNCCPPPGSNLGTWSVLSKPTGSTVNFASLSNQITPFFVDIPGAYILRYTWPAPYNSAVETEYYFFGPVSVELSAPDVCGLTTLVSYVRTSDFEDPNTTVEWFLNDEPYMGPEFTEDFNLTVPWCGLWKLSVTVTPQFCDPVTETIWIDFSCDPVADAGEDAYVCYDNCYMLGGTTGLAYTFSSNYAFTFVQLNGPASLVGLPAGGTQGTFFATEVCLDEEAECPYGVYEIQFQVVNGECYDEDEMYLTFYEAPTAFAGEDQSICSDLCFSLEAVPYEYCGEDGVNYFKHAWWELVSQPGGTEGCAVVFDEFDPETNVCVVNEGCECAYGEYVFRWNELNVKVVGEDTLWSEAQCWAYDEVTIILYEQPDAFAGDDYWACVDAYNTPYTFQMQGTMDYCYTMYGEWTKSCGPGMVDFDDPNDPNTVVSFNQPGKYEFVWTLWNEECEDSDTVLFYYLEQPEALVEVDELTAECDELCIDLGDAGVVKYEYFGTDQGDCPNYTDMGHWTYVDGPLAGFMDPATAIFADDTDPATELCVSYYGAYTVRWNEVNTIDGYECTDHVDVFVEFFETPDPFAGDDDEICGPCYTLQGVPYEYLPFPNQHQADYYWWTELPTNPAPVAFSDFEAAQPGVCIPDDPWGTWYGTYGFVLHQMNGEECMGTDTVYITFNKVPDPVCLAWDGDSNCDEYLGGDKENGFYGPGCICPDEVIYVCAESCTDFWIDPYWCEFGYDPFNPQYPMFQGWTFEWSVTGPAGMTYQAQPGYYDWSEGHWVYPHLEVCWGECCDTARVYLTITTPDCEITYEYKVFVNHKPCIDIVGPEVSEVGLETTYCNVCEDPEFDTDCLLYTWTVEHCGVITGGQGTDCITVEWTDYNINDGWGRVTLTILDTCTGCCNYDEMMVKIYPPGTLGTETLSGYVMYHNEGETPLNGVEIQLWNGGIPVMSTTSFTDVEGENGPGYYEFSGISNTTVFDISASYDAMWYGANATDALAVELKTISALPGTFTYDTLVFEAMDANNNGGITATDALWIKQRAISMVNYFPAGDWVFPADMSSGFGTYDIYALNAGDANRSNVPNSAKAAPAIALINDGVMNVVAGTEFELPIRIADAAQLGAITLNLGYDASMIEVTDVVTTSGMITNLSQGNISIAWSSVNPMILAENDAVITLRVRTTGEVASTADLFSIEMGSEFADATARVIEPVTLKTYGITTGPAAEDYFLSTNRPNPFSTSTFIEYTLPETGKVKLSVLDMLGQEIAVVVEATQPAGSYTVEFGAAGLATGVYVYKITVDGETRDYISTQRMVISH